MSATIVLVLLFAVLLWIDWRHRLRSIRVVTAVLALLVWQFNQGNPTAAARRALDMPVEERITAVAGAPLSEYASGVRTMELTVAQQGTRRAGARLLGVGVLFWLACSPAYRKGTTRSKAAPRS